jgi:hypothetical protein
VNQWHSELRGFSVRCAFDIIIYPTTGADFDKFWASLDQDRAHIDSFVVVLMSHTVCVLPFIYTSLIFKTTTRVYTGCTSTRRKGTTTYVFSKSHDLTASINQRQSGIDAGDLCSSTRCITRVAILANFRSRFLCSQHVRWLS